MTRNSSDPAFRPIARCDHTRFVFERHVSMDEVADTLRLARLAAGSLHGTERVKLQNAYTFDPRRRTVSIEAISEVGHTLALLFLGFIRREFGERAFTLIPASRSSAGASRTEVLS